MAASYRRDTPGQELLLPPSLHDWLPEGHLAYFIADVAGQLDPSRREQRAERVAIDLHGGQSEANAPHSARLSVPPEPPYRRWLATSRWVAPVMLAL